jgi:hypothetical protein
MLSTQLLAVTITPDCSPLEQVLPVSSNSDKYTGEVTVSATYSGDPQHDKNEFRIKKTEWYFSLAASEGATLTATEGKLNEWTDTNAVTCEIYNTKTGSSVITGTIKVRFTFAKRNRRVRQNVPVPVIETANLEDKKNVKVWFVGIGNLQFKKTTDQNWKDFKDDNNQDGRAFFKKVNLDFKVTKEPSNAPSWPNNFPKWKVSNPDTNLTGTDECNNIEFKLDTAEKDEGTVKKGDYIGTSKKRTVTVKCGASSASAEVEVFLYKLFLNSLKDGAESHPFPSAPASFVIKRDRSIGELTVPFSVIQDAAKLGNDKRLAVKGTDFNIPNETEIFPDGVSEVTVEAAVVNDAVFEGDEYFGIQITEDKKNYVLSTEENQTPTEQTPEEQVAATDVKNGTLGFGILKITDANKLELQKIVFKSIEDLKPDPLPVTTPPTPVYLWGAGPHWEKSKSLNSNPSTGFVPVAYSGGKKIQIEATFKGKIDTNPALDVYSYFETQIAGTDYSSDKSEESKMVKLTNTIVSDTIIATYSATADLAKKVACENALSINFIYQPQGGANKLTETATSCMYVTRDTPKAGTELYHTVVHIGCSAAHNESDEVKVFEKIWSKFGGTDVCISKIKIENGAVVDDTNGKLYYYGIAATVPAGSAWRPAPVPSGTANSYSVARKESTATTKDILMYADGRCGAWQRFFLDVVQSHKIDAFMADMYAVNARYLVVKEGLGKHHSNGPRERVWPDHAIIVYNDKFYDTSYGMYYGALTEGIRKILKDVIDRIGVETAPGNYTWSVPSDSSSIMLRISGISP